MLAHDCRAQRPGRSTCRVPGGQSGNPGSRHYDDLIDDWATGKYHKVQFTNRAEDIRALYTLSIEKKGK
ncbi:MAG: hypothetical protein DRI69_01610 [Bacteroidetes bacterium]|nr:MAG: hypothetical protein DRI69_01610 [Bacteroidota bacterium]